MRLAMTSCLGLSLLLCFLNAETRAQQQPQQGTNNNQWWSFPQWNADVNVLSNTYQANIPLYMGNATLMSDTANQTAGMSLAPADSALRAHLKLPEDQGLIVTSLDVHSPAAQAGLQQNDILLNLENASLGKPEDLENCLKSAGDKRATLTILRSGKKLTIEVQPRVSVTMAPVQPEPPPFWIGVSVAPIEPALRAQLNIPPNQGLLAIDVMKDSPASQAEIKVHDILLTLSGQPLTGQDKLVEIVQAFGEKPIVGKLIREGKTQTYEVTPRRRKSDHVNVNVNDPRTFAFQVVRPGFVLSSPNIVGEAGGALTTNFQIADPKQPQDASAALAKRLDDFDAEIKQLRTAIEELNRTLKDKK
jgi:membrane-associated protease RseP (regulator of RpoE activity)